MIKQCRFGLVGVFEVGEAFLEWFFSKIYLLAMNFLTLFPTLEFCPIWVFSNGVLMRRIFMVFPNLISFDQV